MGRRDRPDEEIDLRVASKSPVQKVAGALVKNLQEDKKVTLTAIGAGAISQMMKATAIARGMAATHGWDLWFRSGFTKEILDGEEKSAIRIFVFRD